MAASPAALSFDDIIQAGKSYNDPSAEPAILNTTDRQRRKNEVLAQQIFGKNRRSNTPSNAARTPGSSPSLASRVGITKASQRSTSTTPKLPPNADSQNRPVRNGSARSLALSNPMSRPARIDRRNDRLQEVLQNGSTNGNTEEFSIRGLAGPYVVMGSNFAPGTTAADIESAMAPTAGEMQSCRIITSSPTVIAEMVFVDRQSADTVISTFNNKKVPQLPASDKNLAKYTI